MCQMHLCFSQRVLWICEPMENEWAGLGLSCSSFCTGTSFFYTSEKNPTKQLAISPTETLGVGFYFIFLFPFLSAGIFLFAVLAPLNESSQKKKTG